MKSSSSAPARVLAVFSRVCLSSFVAVLVGVPVLARAESSPGVYLPGAGPSATPSAAVSVQAGGLFEPGLFGPGELYGGVAATVSVDPVEGLGVEALGGVGSYGNGFTGLTARYRFGFLDDHLGVAPFLGGAVVPRSVPLGLGPSWCNGGTPDQEVVACAYRGRYAPILGGGLAIEGGGRHFRGDASWMVSAASLTRAGHPQQEVWGPVDPLYTLLASEAGVRWEGRGGRDAVRLGVVGVAPTLTARYGVTRRIHLSAGIGSLWFTGFRLGVGGTLGRV